MFVNGITHHNEVREKLIELYKTMTERHFWVIAPRSAFLTTEQLEVIEQNPPLAGIGLFSTPYQMKVTIEKIINAYILGGEGYQIGFRYPSRDVIIIYETIQESIRLWTDIKLNSYQYESASMEELEAMEMVARSLFGMYRMFYKRKVNKELELEDGGVDDQDSMVRVYLNIMNHGLSEPEEVSFISYIDLYRAKERGETNSFTGSYAKQNLNVADIPPDQPRRFDRKKEKSGMGNWLDD